MEWRAFYFHQRFLNRTSFTWGRTRVPNSGSAPSAGEGMWVETMPVSFTSYAMDASCTIPQ